jgi:DNA-binding FadR family transcriptional regulator
VQITGNRPLLLFANVVRGVYLRGRERFLGLYARDVFDPRLHERAVEAIRAKNPEAAGAAMREHATTAFAAAGTTR